MECRGRGELDVVNPAPLKGKLRSGKGIMSVIPY